MQRCQPTPCLAPSRIDEHAEYLNNRLLSSDPHAADDYVAKRRALGAFTLSYVRLA